MIQLSFICPTVIVSLWGKIHIFSISDKSSGSIDPLLFAKLLVAMSYFWGEKKIDKQQSRTSMLLLQLEIIKNSS